MARSKDFLLQSCHELKTYGAVSDGIADDTEAAQVAIDAAYADGGGYVVFRGPAKYKVDMDALEIKVGVTLIGYRDKQLYWLRW